jgi:hypothetical protein
MKLTLEILEAVTEEIRKFLEGKKYTFVSFNDGFAPDSPIGVAARTDQEMKDVTSWVSDDGKVGGFHVSDTDYIWGAMTDGATVELYNGTMIICQKAPAGHNLVWKIYPQRRE